MSWFAPALLFLALAPASTAPEPLPRLRVAVGGGAPFVVREGGAMEGVSVEVWREVARRLQLGFDWVPFPTVPSALDALRSNEVDVVVGPVSITSERLEHMEFTHRYFEASLGILAPRVTAGPTDWLKPFVSRPFIIGVSVLLGVLFVVGALLWLLERRRNPQHFPPSPLHGVGNGVWMALVTMTTVGYGDRVPVTLPGRVLTGAWMLIAMVTASSLTAGIATALTLQHLETGTLSTMDQLRGRPVAAVKRTTAERFVRTASARLVPSANTEAAIAHVLAGRADAVVDDKPILQHWLVTNAAPTLTLSERAYEPQGYGFALPLESPLTHRLNLALQELKESGKLRAIRAQWLGSDLDG